MSYRSEIKFPFKLNKLWVVFDYLNKNNFSKLFDKRFVTSVYFDNNGICYHESNEGILPRYKYRLRGYNNENFFNFEKKISSFDGRFKDINKISSIQSKNLIKTGFVDDKYGHLKPVIITSYWRSYFTNQNIRITLDESISYKKYNSEISVNEFMNVVEIKSNNPNYVKFFRNEFPFNDQRFSKFSRAYEKVNFLI